ncbi:MAG: GxxExxY protein [Acidobacteria bacterium]|nr:GxxExxY protein [Acidobacteriota bacterium]
MAVLSTCTRLPVAACRSTKCNHENTKARRRGVSVLKVSSQLSDDLEALIHRTIGCCIDVHRALGPGLLETIYSRAVELELTAAGISFESEKTYPVRYRGQLLCSQRLDVVVEGQLVLEIKSVEQLAAVHRAQLLSYLRVSSLRVGLLLNFNVPVLQEG